jgi:precorrin-6x reductase
VATKDCPGISVWAGSRGIAARKKALTRSHARVLVDATHPYASAMSEQLIELSRTLGIPYLRYERPSARAENSGELCASIEQAAARAIALGKRIFVATGSKDLATFLQAPGAAEREWFVRLTPEPTFMQRAIDLGVARSHICAMQGPFSQEFNLALWRDWQIDCVVTKDSGDAGGYQAKVAAAHTLGIPVLVIQRPTLTYPIVVSTFDAVLRQLQAWDITA